MSAQPDPRCHPPTKHDPADGISRASWQQHKHAEQKLQTTRQRIAGQAFRHRGLHRKQSNHGCRDLVSSGCSQLRVRQWQREQREHHEQAPASFATAPLAIHNHKAIFGWAANLFLAAATSQTTTAEKSGPPGLGDPVPGRGDVEGTADCAPPQPLPHAAHIPHPTGGLAWSCPAWRAQPQPTPPARFAVSLYLSASSPFASLFMPRSCSLLPHSLAPSLIDNLPIGLVFYRWCFRTTITRPKVPHPSRLFSGI